MILAVDVGNTNIVFGLYNGETNLGTFRLMTNVHSTSDEIGLSICQYLSTNNIKAEEIDGVAVCSVVPNIMHALNNAVWKYLGTKPYIVYDNLEPGLKVIETDSKETLGADRAVACIQTIRKYGCPSIVVDFGTATKFDALDENGVYIGGCIMTGLRVASEALANKAALLPSIELNLPSHILNTTAVEQIQSGVVGGYIGAVEFLIEKIKKEFPSGQSIHVIATGGLSSLIAKHTKSIQHVDPYLILDGLAYLYYQNAS